MRGVFKMENGFILIIYIIWRVFYWGQMLQSSGEIFWQRKYIQIRKKDINNTFLVINR